MAGRTEGEETAAGAPDGAERALVSRTLFELAADAVLVTDDDGRVLDLNTAACELFGRSRQELSGARLDELMKADASAVGAWSEFHPEDAPLRVIAVERPDGLLRYAELRTLPRLDSGMSLSVFRDVTVATRAMAELRRSQANLMMSQRLAHVGSWELDLSVSDDLDANPLRWTDELYRIFGYEPGAVEVTNELFFNHTHPDDRAAIQAAVRRALDTGGVYSIEHRIITADGRERIVHERGEIVTDPVTGRAVKMLGTAQDITELRSLELQLRQSQKMEAVGRLAGGVAHDFNNLLTIVNGYCWMLLNGEPREDPRELIAEIHQAGERAAALTRRLLAFSRQSVLEPKVLDLNALLADSERMIRRLVGEDVAVELALASRPAWILADPVELTQVVLNLAGNARDAMPCGGRLRISTEHVEEKADQGVLLTVTDTGTGMTPEVAARIFEPFFTTKEVGKGTGLGLATVYGIVQQSGGRISVDTEPGRGSRFSTWFPSHSAPGALAPSRGTTPLGGSDQGTLLLVEDDPAVRQLVKSVLERHGYAVLDAENGAQALSLAEGRLAEIDLVITDVVMPDMSGRELTSLLRERRSQLRVLYMSGYTNDEILRRGVQALEVPFLQKPFSPDALIHRVRTLLATRS